jgi:hypothetical protein
VILNPVRIFGRGDLRFTCFGRGGPPLGRGVLPPNLFWSQGTSALLRLRGTSTLLVLVTGITYCAVRPTPAVQ